MYKWRMPGSFWSTELRPTNCARFLYFPTEFKIRFLHAVSNTKKSYFILKLFNLEVHVPSSVPAFPPLFVSFLFELSSKPTGLSAPSSSTLKLSSCDETLFSGHRGSSTPDEFNDLFWWLSVSSLASLFLLLRRWVKGKAVQMLHHQPRSIFGFHL